MAKAANKPRKRANGYKMPDPLPKGLVLEDITKKKWKLGPSIGKGGFGEIYSADEYASTKSSGNYPYVVKIEPHSNGPLFVEMHFYMRCAKPADIEAFKSKKKLNSLGMPEYLGSGSQEHNSEKYRFLVMKKFGTDIWKLFLQNKRSFPEDTVFKLGLQILDALEYIHSKGYIHADIKGANVLMGTGKEANHQMYLVDFGLCSHYDKKYKPNPKKAHNGTIEYLSRDAHLGVESRRGDLEILGYNLTQWLGCTLPWEKKLSDPVVVQKSKEEHMQKLPEFFKACFGKKSPPAAIVDYFKYVTSLSFDTDPDYKKLNKILLSGLAASGGTIKSPLRFKSTTTTPLKRRSTSHTPSPAKKSKVTAKKIQKELLSDEDDEHTPQVTPMKRGRKPKSAPLNDEELNSHDIPEEAGYTAEMLRIKNKIKTAQKSTKAAKPKEGKLRKRNDTNHDHSITSNRLSGSFIVVSDSEDERITTRLNKKRIGK